MYDHLDYFNVSYAPRWDYSKVCRLESRFLFTLQLIDGRLCGTNEKESVVMHDMDTFTITIAIRSFWSFRVRVRCRLYVGRWNFSM